MVVFVYISLDIFCLIFLGATVLTVPTIPLGSGSLFLDDVRCRGVESRLLDCIHNGIENTNCGHSQDAGVRCVEGMFF